MATGLAARPLAGRPLSSFLTLLVLNVLVPSIVLTAWLIRTVGVVDRERANQEALLSARGVAGDLDRALDGSIETLVALATSRPLRQGDLEGFHRQATEAMQF